MSDQDNYEIFVNVDGPYEDLDFQAVQTASWYALDMAQAPVPAALTVLLTTSEAVHELNLQYAENDYETDVLSFPSEGDPYATEPGQPPYLGDVIVAVPVAQQQATAAGHTLTAELQLLTIHGTLHLLGYDHDSPENQAVMWALQSAAMDAVRSAGAGA
jgi:probable rRNA maturation factor